jgi:hypothetical protein
MTKVTNILEGVDAVSLPNGESCVANKEYFIYL